ncbi:dihydrofolate reductase family protein [Jiangella asiatica]|uniref:Deaminase n=1 Tax=Jiangella asiatica TaxID=2530372 RepID=A0A4R5CFA8_9ACTN|nr:dihydrofolate reductase family protein [Jiangella asiatica]TDD98275.1 deaminase [Jiangella asiatica]
MRTLVVTNIVTPDGRYAGPGDDIMVMPFDETFDDYNAERLQAADTVLLGRRSFEGFKGFWPQIADDDTVRPVEREISRQMTATEKVVVSDTLTPEHTAPWTNTRIVRRADAHAQVKQLKSGDGGEILVFGSHLLWNDLLAAGLVDELHLLVGSALLGAGVPVFEGQPRAALRLLEARRLGASQLALLRYDARHAD